ncbi:MAG: hypothetical protein LE169_03120 [Endomicrobium sp.]|nr:hypothetical protein [Endomicrobium sp.]
MPDREIPTQSAVTINQLLPAKSVYALCAVALAFVILRYKSRAKSLELREKQIELNKRELDKADSKLSLKILAAIEYPRLKPKHRTRRE